MKIEDFLAARIAELRIKCGVSAQTMSFDLGKARGYITTIENGKALPSVGFLSEICEYFGISEAEFYSTKVPDLPDPKQTELIYIYNHCDEETADEILEIARLLRKRKKNPST